MERERHRAFVEIFLVRPFVRSFVRSSVIGKEEKKQRFPRTRAHRSTERRREGVLNFSGK